MIHVKTKDGKIEGLTLRGDVVELQADMCVIMRTIYLTIKEDNPMIASFFKEFVRNDLGKVAFMTKEEVVKEIERRSNQSKGGDAKEYECGDEESLTEQLCELKSLINELEELLDSSDEI